MLYIENYPKNKEEVEEYLNQIQLNSSINPIYFMHRRISLGDDKKKFVSMRRKHYKEYLRKWPKDSILKSVILLLSFFVFVAFFHLISIIFENDKFNAEIFASSGILWGLLVSIVTLSLANLISTEPLYEAWFDLIIDQSNFSRKEVDSFLSKNSLELEFLICAYLMDTEM